MSTPADLLTTARPTRPAPAATRRTAARLVLAAASAAAGVIHLAVTPEHVADYAPLGIGFLLAGTFQVLWAVVVAARDSRAVLIVGSVGSLTFVAVYLLSRTVGLPLGPHAFQPEVLGAPDLLCCALELLVAVGGLALAVRPAALDAPLGRWSVVVGATAVILIGAATTSALAAPGHSHEHESCPVAPVRTGVLDARGVDTGVTAYFSCRLHQAHGGPEAHHE